MLIRPSRLANLLIGAVASPIWASILGCIYSVVVLHSLDVQPDHTTSNILVLVGLILGAATGYWHFIINRIFLDDSHIQIRYTRYLISRSICFLYNEIEKVVLVKGNFSMDGRPKPRMIFTSKSGVERWFPLPTYTHRDIQSLVEILISAGVNLQVST